MMRSCSLTYCIAMCLGAVVLSHAGNPWVQSQEQGQEAQRPRYTAHLPQVQSNRNTSQSQGDVIGLTLPGGSVKNGTKAIGHVDENGKTYNNQGQNDRVKYTQSRDGTIYSISGEPIGKSWPSGKVEWNCRPKDECKSVLSIRSDSRNLVCDDSQCKETSVKDKTLIYDSFAKAVSASRDKFVNSCNAESSYKVLRTKTKGTDGRYGYLVVFREYYQNAEVAKRKAPVSNTLPEKENSDFEVVALLHNHPTKEGNKYDWFSTGDAMTAKKRETDVVLYGCTTGVFRWLHSDTGTVTDINGNKVDLPGDLRTYPISNLKNADIVTNYDSLERNGYKYYSVEKSDSGDVYLGYKEYEITPYSPRDWGALACKDDDCRGIEGDRIALIDLSKLEWLAKRHILLLKDIRDKGVKASERELATYNANAEAVRAEMIRIADEINKMNLSEDEQKCIVRDVKARIEPYCKKSKRLIEEVVAKGLVGGLMPFSMTEGENDVLKKVGMEE